MQKRFEFYFITKSSPFFYIGIVVKCHESRLLQQNQKLARENLLNKLDDFYNGDNSVSAQKKRIDKLNAIAKEKKKEKMKEMKMNFKRLCEESNKD